MQCTDPPPAGVCVLWTMCVCTRTHTHTHCMRCRRVCAHCQHGRCPGGDCGGINASPRSHGCARDGCGSSERPCLQPGYVPTACFCICSAMWAGETSTASTKLTPQTLAFACTGACCAWGCMLVALSTPAHITCVYTCCCHAVIAERIGKVRGILEAVLAALQRHAYEGLVQESGLTVLGKLVMVPGT